MSTTTISGKTLDMLGQVYGVPREVGQSDDQFRNEIMETIAKILTLSKVRIDPMPIWKKINGYKTIT